MPRTACKLNEQTRRLHKGGGFTLVELVVVMAILAIVAATAAPALNSLGSTRAAAAGRHLLGDTTYARQRALATGTVCWVVFGVDGSWTVLSEDVTDPGRDDATVVHELESGRPMRVVLAEAYSGVDLVTVDIQGGWQVGFDWMGRPVIADSTPLTEQGAITLSGNVRVTVESHTGYARFHAP